LRVFIFILFLLSALSSDEIRPAYLEIQETTKNTYKLLFKTPKGSEKGSIKLSLVLPTSFKVHSKSFSSLNSYTLMHLEFTMQEPINKQVIKIKNLNHSSVELIAKLVFLDGGTSIKRVLPQSGQLVIEHNSSFIQPFILMLI